MVLEKENRRFELIFNLDHSGRKGQRNCDVIRNFIALHNLSKIGLQLRAVAATIISTRHQCDQIGQFLHFGQPFKAGGNYYFTQIAHILRQFL